MKTTTEKTAMRIMYDICSGLDLDFTRPLHLGRLVCAILCY